MTESTKSQTVLDLESARRNSILNVALVREFLHGMGVFIYFVPVAYDCFKYRR